MENKKYISLYLPEKLADKIESIKDDSLKEEEIMKFFDRSKEEIKSQLECLEEDVIRYKGLMISARNSFKEAKNEELNANYELWEKFDKDLSTVREKVGNIKNELIPLKKELQEVNNLIGTIQDWKLKDFLKTLSEINEILSYDNNKNRMIKFLMDNFKVKED